jgi:hypothetical protein
MVLVFLISFLLMNNLKIIYNYITNYTKLIKIIIRLVNFHQDSSAKDRWIGAYSIGLTSPGKLGCPRKNNNNSFSL